MKKYVFGFFLLNISVAGAMDQKPNQSAQQWQYDEQDEFGWEKYINLVKKFITIVALPIQESAASHYENSEDFSSVIKNITSKINI